MSRRPSRLPRRQSPVRRALLPLLASLAAVLTLTPGSPVRIPVASAADDPGQVLDEPMLDAAWVDRGSSGPPDLLTLSLSDAQQFGAATLTLLRRAETWQIQAKTQLQLGSDFDGGSPWFVQLAPGRFAVVANTSAATGTLTTVKVDEASLGAITVERRVDSEIAVSAAGVADVDGDGTPEIVLGGVIGGYEAPCPTAAIEIRSTDERLTARNRTTLHADGGADIAYFNGASFGRWDGRPGTDLLMHAYQCAEPDGVERHHLLAVRLADLSMIRDNATSEQDMLLAGPLPNPPAVVDIDRDGRDEAIIPTRNGMVVVDPTDDWASTPISNGSAALVGAVDDPPRGIGTSVVDLRSTRDPAVSGVVVTRLSRVAGHVRADEGPIRTLDWTSFDALESSLAYLRDGTWSEQPPVLVHDIDGDGCADLVAPLVFIGCAGRGVLEPAPGWLASRPVALVGQAGDRLLVADGLDWYPSRGGTMSPSPLAARDVRAWRASAGSRFVLAEVQVGHDGGPTFQVQAVPPPAIERAASQDGVVEIRRPAGTRLLARVIASGGAANLNSNATQVTTPSGFLYSDPIDSEWTGTAGSLSDQPNGTGYGEKEGVQRLRLAGNVTSQTGAIVDQWILTVAALDATGTLSTPAQATAVLDVKSPDVKLETPTFSTPWPFTGAIRGTSEPGASVSLTTGGTPVVVRADGTFELPVQLAPWPQDVGVQAVDPAGNKGLAKASIMGGVDLRGLPWPAIGVVVVLMAVFLSSIRGVRSGSVRQVRPIAVDANDENATVIEELSVGRIERRD